MKNSLPLNFIIVTNTINRPINLVERSLQSSLKQPITPHSVILLDQNEKQLIIGSDIEKNSLFVHQQVNAKSVSAARNRVEIPEGIEWVIFCDDDGYLCKDYTQKFMNIITQYPALDVLAGSIKREDTGDYYSYRHKVGGSLKKFRNTKNLMGSNFICKVSVFNELQRFDERFGAGSYWGSGEETDFCWKAFFAGKKMEYFSELVVYHVPPFTESVSKGFKKSYKYGIGKGALVWKWLFVEKQLLVLYELAEMFIVPIVQFFAGLLKGNIALSLNYIGIFTGRLIGLFKAVFSF